MKYLYRSVFLFILLVPFSGTMQYASAQKATESVAEWQKVKHPVFTTTLAYPAEIVEGALLEKLQKDHISAKQGRHTITCKAVVYPELSASPLDIYFRTESKSKKDGGSTSLKMFISKGRDNFIGKAHDDVLAEKALDYLDHFQKDVAYYALRKKVYEKEKALEEAREDYQDRLDDKQDLYDELYDRKKDLSAASGKDIKKAKRKIRKTNKKIHRAEDDIREAERDMEQRKGEIQALRSRLLEMQDNNR